MSEKVYKNEEAVRIKSSSIIGVIRGTAQINHPNGMITNEYVVSVREVDGKPTRGTMWNGFYLSRLVVGEGMLESL